MLPIVINAHLLYCSFPDYSSTLNDAILNSPNGQEAMPTSKISYCRKATSLLARTREALNLDEVGGAFKSHI